MFSFTLYHYRWPPSLLILPSPKFKVFPPFWGESDRLICGCRGCIFVVYCLGAWYLAIPQHSPALEGGLLPQRAYYSVEMSPCGRFGVVNHYV